MNMFRPFWGFIKSFILGQVRIYAGLGGAYLIQHGLAAGYTQDQLVGSAMCLAAIFLQAFDTFVVDHKVAAAINTPTPAIPATTVTGATPPPLTMQPIPNP